MDYDCFDRGKMIPCEFLPDLRKSLIRYLSLLMLVIIFASPAAAVEVYCSLNDGMKADGKTVLEDEDGKHHFCCSECLDQFKANPNKFAKQIDQPALTGAADAEEACSSVCSE